MNVKEYLQRASDLDLTINTKIDSLNTMRSLLTKTTSVITGMPHGGGDGRSLENAIARIVDLENEINETVDQLVDVKVNIMKMISTLKNPTQRNVMEMRYIQCKSWDEISRETGKSRTTLYHIQKAVIDELEKTF